MSGTERTLLLLLLRGRRLGGTAGSSTTSGGGGSTATTSADVHEELLDVLALHGLCSNPSAIRAHKERFEKGLGRAARVFGSRYYRRGGIARTLAKS